MFFSRKKNVKLIMSINMNLINSNKLFLKQLQNDCLVAGNEPSSKRK